MGHGRPKPENDPTCIWQIPNGDNHLPAVPSLHSDGASGRYEEGVDGVPTEGRMCVGRLLENMTGGTALVESMHDAGSPQVQKVMYSKLSGLEEKKFAAHIAGVGRAGKE